VVNRFRDGTLTGTYNLRTGAAGSAEHPNVVRLSNDVYIRTTLGEVCPVCIPASDGGGIGSTGTCSSTAANAGAECTVDGQVTLFGRGEQLLSSACIPQGDTGGPLSTLAIDLPLSTGTSTALVGPRPCGDEMGLQAQDDGCGGDTCSATCTGAACVDHDDAGDCLDAKGGISQLCCAGFTDLPCFPTQDGGSLVRTGSPGTDSHVQVSAATFCIPRTASTLINLISGLPGPGALLLPNLVHVSPSP
jgi:hypothetical protein